MALANQFGQELGPAGRFVVATDGGVVVVGQAIEEVARHRDFDADRVVDALRVIECRTGSG